MMLRVTSFLAVLFLLVGVSHVLAMPIDPIIAQTGFNDASGINSDALPDSPYQLGSMLAGQGAAELGWAEPWYGGDSAVTVQSAVTFEGDGAALAIPTHAFARKWTTAQTGKFIVDTHVRLTANSRLAGYVFNDVCDNFHEGPVWWAMPDGTFHAHDGIGNSTYNWRTGIENTGFTWTPDTWYKISLHIDVADQTWEFFVNDQKYNAPDPLGFRGSTAASLNGLHFLTEESGSGVYLDNIQVAVPEPSALVLLGMGFVGLAVFGRLGGRKRLLGKR